MRMYLQMAKVNPAALSQVYNLSGIYFIQGASDPVTELSTVFSMDALNATVNVLNSGTRTTVTFKDVTLWLPHVQGPLQLATLGNPNHTPHWTMSNGSRTCFVGSYDPSSIPRVFLACVLFNIQVFTPSTDQLFHISKLGSAFCQCVCQCTCSTLLLIAVCHITLVVFLT